MLDVSREDIVDGSVARSLVVLALPLVAQNLVHVADQIIDIFWVGRLGADAVAAVGLVVPLVGIITAALAAAFVGVQVNVAQHVGADRHDAANAAVANGVYLAFAVAIAVAGLLYTYPEVVVSVLDLDPHVADLAAVYLGIWALSVIPAAVSDPIEAGFVGFGDSRAALYINVTAVVVNLVLDPVLIFGVDGLIPGMGVAGAAYATVAGYAVGGLLAVWMAAGGRSGYRLSLEALRPHAERAREVLTVGVPTGGQHVARQAVRVVIVAIVAAAGGTAGLAAYTVGARVASLAFIPPQGLSQAASSVIGQNLGAGNPRRAHDTTRTAFGIAVAALVVLGVVQWVVPGAIAHLFVPGIEGTTLAYTVDYLRILALGYWAIGATYVFEGAFNGAGRTELSMAMTLTQYWLVRLPIAAVGVYALGMGVHAVFWAVTLSNVVAAVGAGLYYLRSERNGLLERAADAAGADPAG
ncbi:MATE family efflux transporter [Halarchaeum sp. P4]|uniref:MATE family efflux transporter n=1 Tax=Halarchaeum sp. P4 TaxID=3421639 RepID=UPI003EBFAA01